MIDEKATEQAAAPVDESLTATAQTAQEVRLPSVASVRGSDFRFPMGDAMTFSDYDAAMFLENGAATPIPYDLYEYIKYESKRRGVPMADIYREEMEAREKLKQIALPRDRLEQAAQRDYSNHPWMQGEEDCPF